MHKIGFTTARRRMTSLVVLVVAGIASANELPSLPDAVSNNAVTSVRIDDIEYVASFAGISSPLHNSDIHATAYLLDSVNTTWERVPDLPGGVGRLASVAVSTGQLMYIFGGYGVDANGNEVSTPWVHSFDPVKKRYKELQPIPVPVDDAIAITYRDRYVYLISGWHDLGNVNLVQVFDTRTNSWSQATPIPGTPLFGHAGAGVGNRMLYCDGVMIKTHATASRKFAASPECFRGTIDAANFRRIDWHPVDPHPGLPRYRMAAAGLSSRNAVVFIGGSDNPYNFNGIGYNKIPSAPSRVLLLFDLGSNKWQPIDAAPVATMDHRGLIQFRGAWHTVGGMLAQQHVTDRVIRYVFD